MIITITIIILDKLLIIIIIIIIIIVIIIIIKFNIGFPFILSNNIYQSIFQIKVFTLMVVKFFRMTSFSDCLHFIPSINCTYCCIIFSKVSLEYRVEINFSIVICEKNGVLNTAGFWGSCDSPPCRGSRAEPYWETRKIQFLLLKKPQTGLYLFIFHVQFKAV